MEKIGLNELKNRLGGMAVVVDAKVFSLYKQYLPADSIIIHAVESKKSLKTVKNICAKLAKRNFPKDGCIVAVGGGLVGDIVGFLAGIYMRGVDWICVPTTLLAMVDSSVGGKTGVNFGSAKNILGTFHSPKSTLYCVEFLNTLPKIQFLSGWAEVVKTATLDQKTYELVQKVTPTKGNLEKNGDFLGQFEPNQLENIIFSCRDFKKNVVGQDYFDSFLRGQLNFGHTVGHALELKYRLTHGQAVAIGMVAEVSLCGISDRRVVDFVQERAFDVIDGINLGKFSAKKVVLGAMRDKKSIGGNVVMFVPKAIGEFERVCMDVNEFGKKVAEFFGR